MNETIMKMYELHSRCPIVNVEKRISIDHLLNDIFKTVINDGASERWYGLAELLMICKKKGCNFVGILDNQVPGYIFHQLFKDKNDQEPCDLLVAACIKK